MEAVISALLWVICETLILTAPLRREDPRVNLGGQARPALSFPTGPDESPPCVGFQSCFLRRAQALAVARLPFCSGMWCEAAELIWASVVGYWTLPQPDKKVGRGAPVPRS